MAKQPDLEGYLKNTQIPILIRIETLKRNLYLNNARVLDLGEMILENATEEERRIYAEPLQQFASFLEKRGAAKADH